MTPSVFLDLDRLRHPNVGLYNFCKNLGDVVSSDSSIKPTFFIPKSYVQRFTEKGAECIVRTGAHKMFSPVTKKYDVVHITHQFSKYFPNQHPNIILTIHDLNFLYTGDERKRKSYLNGIQKKVNKASTIVAISDFVMEDLKRHLNLEGKKLTRIYNGVHVDEYPDFNTPDYRPKAPFLFSLGVLQAKKNTHTLPALLVDNDYELVIAGMPGKDYMETIEEEARKHGVSSRVKILCGISDQEKYWYLKNCEAYLQPSLSEGFGLPVIEAMSYGKPLFLSDKTSLPEIGGPNAFYFDHFDPDHMRSILNSSLEQYHNDASIRTKLMERARQFTWEQAGKEYIKLYHQTLA